MSGYKSNISNSRKRRERRKKMKDTKPNVLAIVIDYNPVIKQIEQHWPRFVSNPIVSKIVIDMNLTLFDPSNEELKIKILDKFIHYLQHDLLINNTKRPTEKSIIPTLQKGDKCFMNESFLSGIYGTVKEVSQQYNLYDIQDSNAEFSFMDTWNGATSQDIIPIESMQDKSKQIFNEYAITRNGKVFGLQTFNLLFNPCGIKFDADTWKKLIEDMIDMKQKDSKTNVTVSNKQKNTHKCSKAQSKENGLMDEELFLFTMKQFRLNINNCMLRYEYYNEMIKVLSNCFLFDENLCKIIVDYCDVKRENHYYAMWWNQTRMGGRGDYIATKKKLLETLKFRMKEGFKFKIDNNMKKLMERYEKKWNVLLPENLKFIFSLNDIESIISGAHPNNPVPLSAKEWELLDDRNSEEKLKAFDYDYGIKIMEPHQGQHCWYAVWNKNDIVARVCIAWHPQQDISDENSENDKEMKEAKNEAIYFLLTSPSLITFLWDLASVGKCWFATNAKLLW